MMLLFLALMASFLNARPIMQRSVFEEMDSLMNGTCSRSSVAYEEDNDEAEMTLDVPGYNSDSLVVLLEENVLIVKTKEQKPKKKKSCSDKCPDSCACKSKAPEPKVLYQIHVPRPSTGIDKIEGKVKDGQLKIKIKFSKPKSIRVSLE